MQLKDKQKRLIFILSLAFVISTFTILIARVNNKKAGPDSVASPPVQKVYKPTDTIRFTLDLGENPGVYYGFKLPRIQKVHAEATNTYSEGDLTIKPKIVSTVTGDEIPLPLEISKESDTKYTITAENNNYSLVPGKYKVEVDVQQGGKQNTFSQDFNWGVLAINTNKSMYTPGETANIAMAVLDEKGSMVCDADVVLEITNPSGKTTSLSTEADIKVNSNCSKKEYVEEPDYETAYQVDEAGEYNMKLTATTPNGSYTINDSFEVRDYVSFDVERKTATRIYPPAHYPVTLVIKANEDFSGTIEEKIPSSFNVLDDYSVFVERTVADRDTQFGLVQKVEYLPSSNKAVITGGTKYNTLTWQVNLKKGDEFQIQYTYKAPDVSPEFYLLGPLSLQDKQGKHVFSEVRQWQIAADAIAYVNTDNDTGNNISSASPSLTVSANNLVVLFCMVKTSKTITLTGTGWTNVYSESGTPTQYTWYKISAGGTESPTCSWTGGDFAAAIMLEYSGVDIDFPIDTAASDTGSGDDTVECPAVTPSSGNHLYVSAFSINAGNESISSWTNAFNERQDFENGGGNPGQRQTYGAADLISTGTQSTVATVTDVGAWRCHTLSFNEEIDRFSGRAFTDDDEITPLGTQSVCAVYDAGTPTCVSTDGSGYFNIEFDGTAGAAGAQLTFFLDGGTNFGNTVTVHDGGNILWADNLRLYGNHVVIRYEQGTDLSIVDMDAYDSDQNPTDMLYDAEDAATDTLSVEDGNELFIQAGYTFVPGGNIPASHDIEIDGTWDVTTSETINLSGSYKLDTGGVFIPESSTITFDGTAGTEDIITTGTGALANLIINDGGTGAGLTVEVEDPLAVLGNLTITGGTLDVVSGEDNQITVHNNWDNDDAFQPRTGTVLFNGSGATTYTIDANGTGTPDFYNITFNDQNGGSTYQLTSSADVNGSVTITGGTLSSNGNNITVGGSWTNDDVFSEGTSSVTFDGDTNASIDSGCADETTCTNENFYDLIIDKAALGNSIDLSNTHLRVTNTIDLTVGTINQGSSNVQAEGAAAITIGSSGNWSNLSTGNITLGGTLTNSGSVTLNGDGASCGDDDSILIRSTAAVQRAWNGSGTFNIIDTDVQYQAGTANINVQSGTDSGYNGSNWKIFDGCYIFGFNQLLLESLLIN